MNVRAPDPTSIMNEQCVALRDRVDRRRATSDDPPPACRARGHGSPSPPSPISRPHQVGLRPSAPDPPRDRELEPRVPDFQLAASRVSGCRVASWLGLGLALCA